MSSNYTRSSLAVRYTTLTEATRTRVGEPTGAGEVGGGGRRSERIEGDRSSSIHRGK